MYRRYSNRKDSLFPNYNLKVLMYNNHILSLKDKNNIFEKKQGRNETQSQSKK